MFDTAVIGGGLVGASVALGLARAGEKVLLLDGADLSPRASRANFALVWVQGKGLGAPDYALWSLRSAGAWPEFALRLQRDAGLDLSLSQRGGFSFALDEAELAALEREMKQIDRETHGRAAPWELLDGAEVRRRVPDVGPGVVGAVFSPADGHVNALRLLHALHCAINHWHVTYEASRPVTRIEPIASGFRLYGEWGTKAVPRIVIAAGTGSDRLAAQVGIDVPLKRSRGQVVVTEKCAPFFPYVSATLRQTDEGSVLIGDSDETDTDSIETRPDIASVMSARAMQVFPRIADLNVLRSWTGFRVKTRDGLPIYQQSADHPGAFAVLCHSGVTLAALHADVVARQIHEGALSGELAPFSTGRFNVQASA